MTVENGTINGGFDSAVGEVVLENRPVPLERIGVKDRYVESGGIEELFEIHEMTPRHIANAARRVVRLKEKGTISEKGRPYE